MAFLFVATLAVSWAGPETPKVKRPDGYKTTSTMTKGAPTHADMGSAKSQETEETEPGQTSERRHYGAKNGNYDDKRYKLEDDDDRIVFKVEGASIDSRGFVASYDSSSISQVQAALEAEDKLQFVLEAAQGGGDGQKGKIWVANEITSAGKYAWDSGLYHQVVCDGWAKDIWGNKHTFRMKTTQAGNKTVELDSPRFSVSVNGGADASTQAGGDGKSETHSKTVKVGYGASASFDFGGTRTTTTGSQPGEADTPGGECKVIAVDSVEGKLTLTWRQAAVSISSYVDDLLKAQALSTSGPLVKTHLQYFYVRNKVRGTAWRGDDYPQDAPADPVPGVPDNWVIADAGRIPSGHSPRAVVTPSGCAASVSLEDAYGLESDSGPVRCGFCSVYIDEVLETDLTFAVSCDPAGRCDVPEEVTIAAGEKIGTFRVIAETAGEYDLQFTLLDEFGAPTATTLLVHGVNDSTANVSSPLVYANAIGSLSGRAGSCVGDLIVGRLGFDDFATESTQIAVSVVDPNGVLLNFPSSMTIPAGEATVEMPIEFTQSVGTATITVSYGNDELIEVVVDSLPLEIIEPASLRLPVGTDAWVPISLTTSPENNLTLFGASSNTSVLQMLTSQALIAGGSAEGASSAMRVSAVAVGLATIDVDGGSLGEAEIEVDVVAGDIQVGRTSIVITDASGSAPGAISFVLPEDVEFATVVPQSGSDAYMAFSGVGTDHLVLRFLDGQARPSTISLDIVLGGAAALDPVRVFVDDDLHPAQVLVYGITIPAAQ